jgi:hypothetical protein
VNIKPVDRGGHVPPEIDELPLMFCRFALAAAKGQRGASPENGVHLPKFFSGFGLGEHIQKITITKTVKISYNP